MLLIAVSQLKSLVLPNRKPGSFGASVAGQELTLLIGKYPTGSDSPIGRGTKGFFAYVVGKQRLVFLKLTWRTDDPDNTDELKIYERLKDGEVPFIPDILGGGNVHHVVVDPTQGPQPGPRLRTRTQEFTEDKHMKLLPRVQFRLVIETLCIPLVKYKHSSELLLVVLCAYTGEFLQVCVACSIS